jgi:hypothetical protein
MVDDNNQGRSYGEVSGKSLSFIKRQAGGHLKQHVISHETASAILAKGG